MAYDANYSNKSTSRSQYRRRHIRGQPYQSHRSYDRHNDDDDEKAMSLSSNILSSKLDYRQQVWQYMEDNNIARFPRPVFNRIPNFIGADRAAKQLLKLECFRSAQIVKSNPDKPQQHARFLVLKRDKTLLVPTPHLRSTELLNEVRIPTHLRRDHDTLQFASTAGGLKKYGYLLSWNELLKWRQQNLKINICIVGSVAVDRNKGYRIGKGKGFADMEIAIFNALGIIDASTTFVTIVHDCQVYDELNSKLFDPNTDVMLDYILTPTQIIEIKKTKNKKASKQLPYKIDWSKLDKKRIESIPVLKYLHQNKHRIQQPQQKQ